MSVNQRWLTDLIAERIDGLFFIAGSERLMNAF